MRLSIFLIFLSFNLFSQVNISNIPSQNNPVYLIDNILIGNGVTTSNHLFNGDSSQIGYFTDSLGEIGFTEGFIMSTGSVDSIGNTGADTLPWWNYIYDSAWNIIDSTPVIEGHFLSTNFFGLSDPDLLTIANSVPGLIGQTFTVSSTGDAAILEFDFVPSADTVEFRYVFASEEYLDFVNSSYNDVFAFLISGPGITGPYVSPTGFPGGAKNIAVVPGTQNWPVTISTVNDTVNSQYYNHDSTNNASAFNGYTEIFTAKSAVIPCNVYHIKLAIADGSDESYDSGVFFEAGSFDATEPGALNVNTITTDLICHGDTNGTVQLCISGGVGPYTTNWFGVNPNNLIAGSYNVSVTDAQGSSGGATYTINQPSEIIVNAYQNGINLESNTIGGTPPYIYDWTLNGVSVSSSNSFIPIQNGIYILSIIDNNGCVSVSDPVNVSNISSDLNILDENNIVISPNPFTNKTKITLLNKSKIYNISLYDLQGREIKKFLYHIENNEIHIYKDNLKSGVYLFCLETSSYITKNKLIIK
tara:strand:+ start:677 stop:2266 length:1590 start_codon:yes stop_codon:yes gene_type:complete